MAKLRENPIGPSELVEFLSGYSDFSFELQTLKMLRACGLECEHGGLYEDPVTKKARQFDIRATARGGHHVVRLAVECKNVRNHFPLLVTCVPRHIDESFHEIVIVGELNERPPAAVFDSRAHVARMVDSDSVYKAGEPVGKSCVQVGRTLNGQIYSSDSDVFEKWAQCLASADDLVSKSYWEGSEDVPSITYVAVIPVLVIPNQQLWMVEYDAEGGLLSGPKQINRCNLFVNNAYSMSVQGPTLRLSHIEIVTLTGLADLVTDCLADKEAMETIFPGEAVKSALHDAQEGH